MNKARKPLGSVETVPLAVERYRDLNGQPTCGADFSCGRVCKFLRMAKFGLLPVCGLIEDERSPYGWSVIRSRGGKAGRGMGTMIPLDACPIWNTQNYPEKDSCRKCGGELKPGVALEQTYRGSKDLGDVCTVSSGGPGRLVQCAKCESCGWSVTAGGAQ